MNYITDETPIEFPRKLRSTRSRPPLVPIQKFISERYSPNNLRCNVLSLLSLSLFPFERKNPFEKFVVQLLIKSG